MELKIIGNEVEWNRKAKVLLLEVERILRIAWTNNPASWIDPCMDSSQVTSNVSMESRMIAQMEGAAQGVASDGHTRPKGIPKVTYRGFLEH